MKNAAAGYDIGLYSRLGAKDARQVFCLRAGDGGGSFVPMFGNPAAAGHVPAVTLSSSTVYGVFAEDACFIRINTKGNAFKRPPRVLPYLGCSIRYFFFAVFFTAFLTAFFAGFLAAFLVAICLFSLVDGLHRFCN
jgi:hypothetical protein